MNCVSCEMGGDLLDVYVGRDVIGPFEMIEMTEIDVQDL